MTQTYDFTTNTWKPIKLCNCRCPIKPVNESNKDQHEQFKITCMVMFSMRPLPSLFDANIVDKQGRSVLEVVE